MPLDTMRQRSGLGRIAKAVSLGYDTKEDNMAREDRELLEDILFEMTGKSRRTISNMTDEELVDTITE